MEGDGEVKAIGRTTGEGPMTRGGRGRGSHPGDEGQSEKQKDLVQKPAGDVVDGGRGVVWVWSGLLDGDLEGEQTSRLL